MSSFFERTKSKQGGAAKSPFKQGVGPVSNNGASDEIKEKDEDVNGAH